jgi:hypothetical protein
MRMLWLHKKSLYDEELYTEVDGGGKNYKCAGSKGLLYRKKCILSHCLHHGREDGVDRASPSIPWLTVGE